MKKILFLTSLLVTMLLGSFSHAAVEVMRRDIKLPTQKMLESWVVSAPATASATALADGLEAAATANTIIPNPAPNGTRNFEFLFVQNFRCGA